MTQLLKKDGFGSVSLALRDGGAVIVRDTRSAHPALAWLASRLAAREAAILTALCGCDGVPALRAFDGRVLERSYLPGEPLYRAPPRSPRYCLLALKLLRALHCRGVAHNDLAKEANWLSLPGERPGIVDFQLAIRSPRRGPLFRLLAYEDLRHWLKHKRTYWPERLTARQTALLAQPTLPARAWRVLLKPVYRFATRRVLGWPERHGPSERHW